MVKPCFIWKNNQGIYHVMDIPCNCYGKGETLQEAVHAAILVGVNEKDIDMEGVV